MLWIICQAEVVKILYILKAQSSSDGRKRYGSGFLVLAMTNGKTLMTMYFSAVNPQAPQNQQNLF